MILVCRPYVGSIAVFQQCAQLHERDSYGSDAIPGGGPSQAAVEPLRSKLDTTVIGTSTLKLFPIPGEGTLNTQ